MLIDFSLAQLTHLFCGSRIFHAAIQGEALQLYIVKVCNLPKKAFAYCCHP